MRFIALAALILSTCSQLAMAKDACLPEEVASVPLHVTPNGRVFMPSRIGEHEVFFELSLSTGFVLLFESAVEPLGIKVLHRTGGTQMWAGGKPITHYAPLENLAVGGFKFARRLAPVAPQDDADEPPRLEGRVVAGSIGATLIRNTDMELNLAERRLKLFKPFKCMGQSPTYWGPEAARWPTRFDEAGALVFTLELEGQKIESGLLAGRNVSRIDSRVTREFFGFDESSDGVRTEASESGGQGLFHAMSLTGGALNIEQNKVELREGWDGCKITRANPVHHAIAYHGCINTVPFTLGIDALSRMRLYYSAKRQTIFVTPVGAGAPRS
jgi:hypothetical protein